MSESKVVSMHRRKKHGSTDRDVTEAMLLYMDKVQNSIAQKVLREFEGEHGTIPDAGLKQIMMHLMKSAVVCGFAEGMSWSMMKGLREMDNNTAITCKNCHTMILYDKDNPSPKKCPDCGADPITGEVVAEYLDTEDGFASAPIRLEEGDDA